MLLLLLVPHHLNNWVAFQSVQVSEYVSLFALAVFHCDTSG